jgi:hypothetical protein
MSWIEIGGVQWAEHLRPPRDVNFNSRRRSVTIQRKGLSLSQFSKYRVGTMDAMFFN